MKWQTSYIVVRPKKAEKLAVVYEAQELREARYWLQYIADPGDAIFTTPLHDRYLSHSGEPIYMCHLIQKGKMDYNESQWSGQFLDDSKSQLEFQFSEALKRTQFNSPLNLPETELLELIDGKAKNLSETQLEGLINLNSKQLAIVLSDAEKWLSSKSILTNQGNDVFVVSASSAAQYPLSVTFRLNENEAESANYDPGMKFLIRPRIVA